MGQELEVTPNMRLIRNVIEFWHRQNFIKVNKNYNLKLNQTPSVYGQRPPDGTKPNDESDPYETEFTTEAWNDTAQIRGRRGFRSILAKAIPGLITLAIESVSSYIKDKQQQGINTMVEELRNDDNKIRNDLRQHRN